MNGLGRRQSASLPMQPRARGIMHVPSIDEIAGLINRNLLLSGKKGMQMGVKGAKHMAYILSSVSSIMYTSKGRDKICSLLQYIAEFYYNCHKHSQIKIVKLLFQEDQITSALVALKIRDSMKNGRKIFKFLKFISYIEKINKLLRKEQSLFGKILEFIVHMCSMAASILDNVLWGINIGALSELIDPKASKTFKNAKDVFSLIKAIFNLFVHHIKFQTVIKQEKDTFLQIMRNETKRGQHMKKDDESYTLCREYLKMREKKRHEMAKLSITFIRILMLMKRLKIPPLASVVDGVFYSVCGIICSVATLAAEYYQQSKFIRIDESAEKLNYDTAKNIVLSEQQQLIHQGQDQSSPEKAQNNRLRRSAVGADNIGDRTVSIEQNLFNISEIYDGAYGNLKKYQFTSKDY